MSSPEADRDSTGCFPDLSKLRDSLLREGTSQSQHYCYSGEVSTKLAAPKDLGSSLNFANLLCNPVQVTFSLETSISSFIEGEGLVRHRRCYRCNCVPPQSLYIEVLTPVTLACDLIWRYCCLVTKSCPTLRMPMDCSLPGSSVHGNLLARVLEWGCHFLLQRIFPTQGSNPHLLPWQKGSLSLSHLEIEP